ncbi:MAG: radical SAM protein [Nitrospinae bacterium]|nr:radical SAM protein [Nitrospinota bacterium]
MKRVYRKSLLYRTKVEYGDYTINHIEGCSHGCKYPCYAMTMAKRFGRIKTYREWLQPKIVANAIDLLDKEIPKMKKDIKSVHLCFMSDPFMVDYPEVSELSLKIIKKLNLNNIKVTTLSKGIYTDELIDRVNFSDLNEYGITLVSLDEKYRMEYEPYTAKYEERIEGLERLHDAGLKTWISIEPFPTPNIIKQDIRKILNKVSFVDKIIFGRLNYNARVSEYKWHKGFYNWCTNKVIEFCDKRKIEYYIKNGTYTKNLNDTLEMPSIEYEKVACTL